LVDARWLCCRAATCKEDEAHTVAYGGGLGHRHALPAQQAVCRAESLCCRTCTPASGCPPFIGRSWSAFAGLQRLQDRLRLQASAWRSKMAM